MKPVNLSLYPFQSQFPNFPFNPICWNYFNFVNQILKFSNRPNQLQADIPVSTELHPNVLYWFFSLG